MSAAPTLAVSPALVRERKFLAEPIATVTQAGEFEGYASLFDVPDLGRDAVMPGAFGASLARRGASGVRMLWHHDPAEPIGRWLAITEDHKGLRVTGKLNLAVEREREIHALMKDGAIDGLSIGYKVERARADRAAGLRRLLALDLWEISVVTFPMLPGARVSAVKRHAPWRSSPAGQSPPAGRSPGGSDRDARLAAAIRRAARSFGPAHPQER